MFLRVDCVGVGVVWACRGEGQGGRAQRRDVVTCV